MASISSNAVTIYNTASRQYLTAPSGMSLLLHICSSLNLHPPDLTSGVDPSDNALAEIYGGGPGSPGDPHTQFTIVKNSDNSIRYAPLPFFQSFSPASRQLQMKCFKRDAQFFAQQFPKRRLRNESAGRSCQWNNKRNSHPDVGIKWRR